MNFMLIAIAVILVIASASIIFILVKKAGGARALFRAQQEAKEILGSAKEEANKIKREASLAAKEKQLNLKAEFERQTRDRSRKLNELERRLVKKEENLERKYQSYEKKERDFSQKERRLFTRERELTEKEKGYEDLKRKAVAEIERIANMSQEEAKKELIKKMEDEAKLEAQQVLRKIEEETREKGDRHKWLSSYHSSIDFVKRNTKGLEIDIVPRAHNHTILFFLNIIDKALIKLFPNIFSDGVFFRIKL